MSKAALRPRPGDGGETHLPAVGRVAKSHPRLVACGSLDELNCAIGEIVARVEASFPRKAQRLAILRSLRRVQRELFLLGALASGVGQSFPGPSAQHRAMLRRLDREIQSMKSELPPPKGFILPGGDPLSSAAQLARAFCRRAERDCVAALDGEPAGRLIVPYLNRLGEWLFLAARRFANLMGHPEESWPQSAKSRLSRSNT